MNETFDIEAARKLARDHMDLEFDLSHTLAEACDEVERLTAERDELAQSVGGQGGKADGEGAGELGYCNVQRGVLK